MVASVSIVICTRDRAENLRLTLDSIRRCESPGDMAAEMVVVDNGSTDGTNQVISEARFNGAPVRRVWEPAPGLSRARNAALRATSSDILLFTDDDVRVPPRWIAGMCAPILSGAMDAVAGGVHFPAEYEPRLAREPLRSRRGWLASTERTDPDQPNCLVGANMAFSRRAADAVGEFDPQLGAGALGFCEETLFASRLLAAGCRIGTAFSVSVEHHFDLSRLTRATLLNMAARMGRSAAYVDYHWEQADAQHARAKMRRAAALMAIERIKTPWRVFAAHATTNETQRVQTFAYWQKLAELDGQPRRYSREMPRAL